MELLGWRIIKQHNLRESWRKECDVYKHFFGLQDALEDKKINNMKPIDLKIGNLLDYPNSLVMVIGLTTHEATFLPVIYNEMRCVTNGLGFKRSWDDPDFPKPIRITEQWMRRVKARKMCYGDLYWFQKSCNGIIFYSNDIGHGAYSNKLDHLFLWNLDIRKTVKIKYVHEFQNIFLELTKKELSIIV